MSDPFSFIIFRFSLIVVELAIFVFLFLLTMKKRKYWIVKSILVVLVVEGIIVGACAGINQLYTATKYDRNITSIFGALIQLVILLLLAIGFYFCFDVSLYELGSAVSLGYAVRWIIFCLYSLIFNFANPDLILMRINQQTPLNISIYVLIYVSYIALTCFMIIKNKKGQFTLELPAFITIIIIILLNTFLISFAESSSQDHLLEYSFVLIANIINLALIIAINFFTQRQMQLRLENDVINSMLVKQTEQYKFNKANAEMLHVKAHDLKHQVAILRKGGKEAEDLLNELESVVYNYESTIVTDNAVLNVIISEKWQYCIKHKIKMTCNVDPKAFSNLENAHLYSLLGNILDNAIEAVMKFKEKEKRIISLNISYNRGVSMLQCYNYFNGKVTFQDGLPLTDKGEKSVHGFGVKSIKNIVDYYNGEINFDIDKDIFNLRISIVNN